MTELLSVLPGWLIAATLIVLALGVAAIAAGALEIWRDYRNAG